MLLYGEHVILDVFPFRLCFVFWGGEEGGTSKKGRQAKDRETRSLINPRIERIRVLIPTFRVCFSNYYTFYKEEKNF